MSEYQYYEFRTIDRVLTAAEIEILDSLSSRAEITPTGFSISYSYSSFRGNPERLMEQYFDAFVYVANWGTRRFMTRLPRQGIDLAALEDFANEAFTFWIKDEFVILSFEFNAEGNGEWAEGEGWMPSLIALRDELLNGDFRSLYIGWLCGAHYNEEYYLDDADELEPPVPPGLKSLTAAQDELASFLDLDAVLIEAAALNSGDLVQGESMSAQIAKWLKRVSVEKKDEWLLELVNKTGRSIRSEILLQFREKQLSSSTKAAQSQTERRTIKDLYDAREVQLPIYEARIAKEAAEEKAKAAKTAAKKRIAELDALSKRADAVWKELEARLSTTATKRFIESVNDLTALRELATRDGTLEAYRSRLEKLLKRHADKPMLQSRVSKAMLAR